MASFKVKSDNIQLDYNSNEKKVANLLNSKGQISSLLVDKIYPKHIKSFSDYKHILFFFYGLIGFIMSVLFFFLVKYGTIQNIMSWLMDTNNLIEIYHGVPFHFLFDIISGFIGLIIGFFTLIIYLLQASLFFIAVGLLYALPALLCILGGIFAGLSFKNSNKGRRKLILSVNVALIISLLFMAVYTYLTWFL